jgi:hypothetical protein
MPVLMAVTVVVVIVMIVIVIMLVAVGVIMPIMVVMVAHECLASLAARPPPSAGVLCWETLAEVRQEIKQGQIPHGSRKCRSAARFARHPPAGRQH